MFYYHYPIIGYESRLPIYLVSIGRHDCQPLTRRGTEYAYPQIFYCTKGSGILLADGTKTEIKSGMGYFIPASYPHEYYHAEDVWDNHWIIPGGYACERMLAEMGFDKPTVFSLDSTEILERLFAKMHDALRHERIYGNLRASGYLYDFLIELDRMEYISKRRIQAAKEMLSGTDMTTEEIAEEVGFGSSSYFCKMFRRYEGITPTQFRSGFTEK